MPVWRIIGLPMNENKLLVPEQRYEIDDSAKQYLHFLQRMEVFQSLAAVELLGTGLSIYGHSLTPIIISTAGAALILLNERSKGIS